MGEEDVGVVCSWGSEVRLSSSEAVNIIDHGNHESDHRDVACRMREIL